MANQSINMVVQPTYEVIKKEDLAAAFEDALQRALLDVLSRIENLTAIYAATAPSSLWTWGYTSRWGFDLWW